MLVGMPRPHPRISAPTDSLSLAGSRSIRLTVMSSYLVAIPRRIETGNLPRAGPAAEMKPPGIAHESEGVTSAACRARGGIRLGHAHEAVGLTPGGAF